MSLYVRLPLRFRRSEDLAQQNTLLYQHLDTVTAQAAQISKNAIDSAAGGPLPNDADITGQVNENTSVETLRGLVSHLRRNLDLSQQQLALAKMESTRLNQQLQASIRELDHIRAELNQVCIHKSF